jgi:predicted nucleic acid-binding protein
MSLVVDPSALLGLAMADEAADYASRVLAEIECAGAGVPSIFWYEIRNVLVVNEWRGRISADEADTFLASLAELPIKVMPLPSELAVLDLARGYRLTVYDAAYLELARRGDTEVATLEQGLRSAAKEAASAFSAALPCRRYYRGRDGGPPSIGSERYRSEDPRRSSRCSPASWTPLADRRSS